MKKTTTTPTTKITAREYNVLDSWFDQEYGDLGANGFSRAEARELDTLKRRDVYAVTWRWAICDQHSKHSIAGIIGSLCKKGLVCAFGDGAEAELEMTEAGFAAWKAYQYLDGSDDDQREENLAQRRRDERADDAAVANTVTPATRIIARCDLWATSAKHGALTHVIEETVRDALRTAENIAERFGVHVSREHAGVDTASLQQLIWAADEARAKYESAMRAVLNEANTVMNAVIES